MSVLPEKIEEHPVTSSGQRIPLCDAIALLAPEQWTALLKLVGGKEGDAIEVLSGRLGGRLFLDAEIIRGTLNPQKELKRYHTCENLRDEIIDTIDARRSAGMELRGYTVRSPDRPVKIPCDLPLEYDFTNGTAQNGELKYHGVTVGNRSRRPSKPSSGRITIACSELGLFCQGYLAKVAPIPSSEALWDAAKRAFPGKHISRQRVREFHAQLVPDDLRTPGPRKKPE
jgi:hypothetical protein